MARKPETITGHNLSEAEQDALRLLQGAGSGVLTTRGQILCGGTVGERFEGDGGIHTRTWLSLVTKGLVYGIHGRLYVHDLGKVALMRLDDAKVAA